LLQINRIYTNRISLRQWNRSLVISQYSNELRI